MAYGDDKVNPLFLQLVISLQSAAWYQMGKIVSPVTGKIERNLDEARVSIDLLTVLQEKTRGNLLDEEKKILDNAVYTLQMNYIDEMNRDKNETGTTSSADDEKPKDDQTGRPAAKDPFSETP